MINLPFGKSQSKDIRREATEIIWKYAIGMLAISIPLVKLSQSSIIPLMVVFGAALGTAAVWGFTGRERKAAPDLAVLEDRIRRLDERLSNMETISNLDRLLAEKAATSSTDNTRQ